MLNCIIKEHGMYFYLFNSSFLFFSVLIFISCLIVFQVTPGHLKIYILQLWSSFSLFCSEF